MAEPDYRKRTLILLVLLAAFRLAYIVVVPFDLSPDEAHYWEWSRRLGLSYYSKGPGVAYVIAFFTGILGDTELGVRIGAVIFSTGASYLMFVLGRDLLESPRLGFYSALLPNVTPIISVGSVLMTTDVLLLFFWAVGVIFVKRALDLGERGGGAWWFAAGAAVGVGFLAKYTMVLLLPAVLLYLAVSKRDRFWLGRPEPYAAALVSLVLATPVIAWNIIHGGVTIMHTMGQAHLEDPSLSMKDTVEFLGSQAGLLTPLIFISVVYGVWKAIRTGLSEGDRGRLLAGCVSATVFAFFFFKSFHGKVQGNWAVASYVTAFPLAAWVFLGCPGTGSGRLARGLWVAALAMGVILSTLTYFPWLLEAGGLKGVVEKAPFNRVTGWRSLGSEVTRVMEEMDGGFVLSDTYQTTSEIAFHTGGEYPVYNVNTGNRRMNQYDLWPGPEEHRGEDALYVKGGRTALDPVVKKAFERCEREFITAYMGERPVKEFTFFRCFDFKGLREPGVDRY